MQVIVLVQPQITVIDLVNEHVLGFQSMSIFKKPNCRQKGTGTRNGKGYRIRGTSIVREFLCFPPAKEPGSLEKCFTIFQHMR